MTDEGCRALARAGCGVQLISLSLVGMCDRCLVVSCSSVRPCGISHSTFHLSSKRGLEYFLLPLLCWGFTPWCTDFRFLLDCLELGNADLQEGVTDVGLCALADAGCGARLTSLTLYSG